MTTHPPNPRSWPPSGGCWFFIFERHVHFPPRVCTPQGHQTHVYCAWTAHLGHIHGSFRCITVRAHPQIWTAARPHCPKALAGWLLYRSHCRSHSQLMHKHSHAHKHTIWVGRVTGPHSWACWGHGQGHRAGHIVFLSLHLLLLLVEITACVLDSANGLAILVVVLPEQLARCVFCVSW